MNENIIASPSQPWKTLIMVAIGLIGLLWLLSALGNTTLPHF